MTRPQPQPAASAPASPAPAPRSARNRFLAALALFAAWIAVLVAMALFSAKPPEARGPAPGPKPVETDAPGR